MEPKIDWNKHLEQLVKEDTKREIEKDFDREPNNEVDSFIDKQTCEEYYVQGERLDGEGNLIGMN